MPVIELDDVIKNSKILFSEDDIQRSLRNMATEIASRLDNKRHILMSVMMGGNQTAIDLGKYLGRIGFAHEYSYIHATRYGDKTTGGNLEILALPPIDLKDKTIILVDDILDGGITLAKIIEKLKKLGAKEVYTAVLLNKIRTRDVGGLETPDFCGLNFTDGYIYGFGLDIKGDARYLRNIYTVNPEYMPILTASEKTSKLESTKPKKPVLTSFNRRLTRPKQTHDEQHNSIQSHTASKRPRKTDESEQFSTALKRLKKANF